MKAEKEIKKMNEGLLKLHESSQESNPNQCEFCGTTSTGYGCIMSPIQPEKGGLHVAVGDENTCKFCHGTDYGAECLFSPIVDKNGRHLHKHGHSKHRPMKCVWCGQTTEQSPPGSACIFSPTGKHEY